MTDDPSPTTAPQSADDYATTPDDLLDFLASVANDSGFEMGITVTVPGGVVTGTLIGYVKWLEETNAALTAASAEVGPRLLEGWLEEERDYQEHYREHSDDEGFEERPIHFLHLRGARHVSGAGMSPSSENPGILWRGRLDRVSGWAIGSIEKRSASAR